MFAFSRLMFENDFFIAGLMIMTEQLPISIYASDELVVCLTKIQGVINRLEAQFNFQTMTANWYGDEDEIFSISLWLCNPEDFYQRKILGQEAGEQTLKEEALSYRLYSDDVFSVYDAQKKQLNCTIAITTGELTLLNGQDKLLLPYLQKKIHKVLNLIAEQLQLPHLLAS